MNIADEMADAVRSAPIIDIDPAFLSRLNPLKAYEGTEMRPEYQVLITSLMGMLDDAMAKGIPRERALAVILGTHEDMVRYVAAKAVKDRLGFIGVGDTQVLQERARNKGVVELQAYLRYAAEKFGTKAEQKVVEKLIKKVTVPIK